MPTGPVTHWIGLAGRDSSGHPTSRSSGCAGALMALVVDVPLNTAIADLDEALRRLLRRELDRHGFEAVEIAFDAPSKEWSGKLTSPTVDLFLYDLREAVERAEVTPSEHRGNGLAVMAPPPLRLELTYAVTAWTKAVEDEHRLLSQVLAILFSYTSLPTDVLQGAPNGGSHLQQAETSVGRPREEKADFWTSVGGQYKASIDYVVHITAESGATFVRGPEVRTQTVRTASSDGPARTMTELHRFGGTVRDASEQPVAGAWVVLPDVGLWTATDSEGRFRLNRIRSGTHRVVVRTSSGEEGEAEFEIPGGRLDIVLGRNRQGRQKRRDAKD
ncbi:MAG: Pvc16 family protein [Actinomycetota bacterium]|nr:Pvc16 family protein [Actinomycetota bacterium]